VFQEKLGQAVEAVDQQEPAGLSLMLEGRSSTYSPLLGLLLPHIICRRQHRLVALVAVEGVRRKNGQDGIKDMLPLKGRIQGLQKARIASALAGQHIDWAHVLSSEVVSRSADLWCLCCRRPRTSGGCKMTANKDADPRTDGA
jgi:hypothetical protein